MKIPAGLYRVYWKKGGSSLAAVGILPEGDRWLAPVNWVHPSEDKSVWEMVDRVDLVHVGSVSAIEESGECEECWGKGYTIEHYGEADQWGVQDYDEKYCSCEAGDRLRWRDGAEIQTKENE